MMKFSDISKAINGRPNDYLVGLILSLIFTLISFLLVMSHILPHALTVTIVFICGALQIITQLMCFLHLNKASEDYWNWLAFTYMLLLLIIILGASMWIMFRLNHYMQF